MGIAIRRNPQQFKRISKNCQIILSLIQEKTAHEVFVKQTFSNR